MSDTELEDHSASKSHQGKVLTAIKSNLSGSREDFRIIAKQKDKGSDCYEIKSQY